MDQIVEVRDLRTDEVVRTSDTRYSAGVFSAEPAFRLFTFGAISFATLLGSPVAGATLLAVNDWRLDQRDRAVCIVLAGVLVTSMELRVVHAAHDMIVPLTIVLLLAMRVTAGMLQGQRLARHRIADGRMSSAWVALATGMGWFAALWLAWRAL